MSEKPDQGSKNKPKGKSKEKKIAAPVLKLSKSAAALLESLGGDELSLPPPSLKTKKGKVAGSKKQPMAFVCSRDLPQILQILVGADKISETEAFMRLQKMCSTGKLQIIPPFSRTPKEVS